MNPLIYLDGTLADDLGRQRIQELVQRVADEVKRPVDLLTSGPRSKFHSTTRFTASPHDPVEE